MSRDPEHFAVDVGYRDPLDERDEEPKDVPSMMDVDGVEMSVARWHVWDSELGDLARGGRDAEE